MYKKVANAINYFFVFKFTPFPKFLYALYVKTTYAYTLTRCLLSLSEAGDLPDVANSQLLFLLRKQVSLISWKRIHDIHHSLRHIIKQLGYKYKKYKILNFKETCIYT